MPTSYSSSDSTRSSREVRRSSTGGNVEILPIIEASSLHKSGSHKHKHHKHSHSHSSSSGSSKSTSSRRHSTSDSGSRPPKIAEKVLCEDSRGNVYKIEYLDKAGNLVKTERT